MELTSGQAQPKAANTLSTLVAPSASHWSQPRRGDKFIIIIKGHSEKSVSKHHRFSRDCPSREGQGYRRDVQLRQERGSENRTTGDFSNGGRN